MQHSVITVPSLIPRPMCVFHFSAAQRAWGRGYTVPVLDFTLFSFSYLPCFPDFLHKDIYSIEQTTDG